MGSFFSKSAPSTTPQRTQPQSRTEKIYKYHRLPTIVKLTPQQISEINVKDIHL